MLLLKQAVAQGPNAFLTHVQGGNQRKAWADPQLGIASILKADRLFQGVKWKTSADWFQGVLNHLNHLLDTHKDLYAPTSSSQERDDMDPLDIEFIALLKEVSSNKVEAQKMAEEHAAKKAGDKRQREHKKDGTEARARATSDNYNEDGSRKAGDKRAKKDKMYSVEEYCSFIGMTLEQWDEAGQPVKPGWSKTTKPPQKKAVGPFSLPEPFTLPPKS